jgi:MFS family permease
VRTFRHRNFRLFFAGHVTSVVGTWMQQIAQAWLILEITDGDTLWLGLVAAAQYVPVLFLGLVGGVLGDMLPKKQTVIAAQLVMAILAAILAALTLLGSVEVWHVLVLAVALGIAYSIDAPVRQAFAIEMVGPDDIAGAVAINSATFSTARVIGPAVAGVTIGALGMGVAFALNALSFLAVIAGLLLIRDEELFHGRLVDRPTSPAGVVAQLREGLSFVRHTPAVLLAVTLPGIVATAGMNFSVVIPPYAQEVIGTDAAGFGFLMTASGIGSLVAAVGLASRRRPRPILVAGGAILLGVATIVLALTASWWFAILLMAVMGFGAAVMNVTANATMQLTVPGALRSRITGVQTTTYSTSIPVGGILTGWLATVVGITATISLSGVVCLIVGLLGLVWWRRISPSWAIAPTDEVRRRGSR